MKSLVYPLTLDSGRLAVTDSYPEIVGDHILAALQTQRYERVMDPDFGLDSDVFVTQDQVANMVAQVSEAGFVRSFRV